MGYLISQIIFCLIMAAVLGVALGWLLHGMLHHQVNDSDALREQLNHCMNENHRLRASLDTEEINLEPTPSPEPQNLPTHPSLSDPSINAADDTEEIEIGTQSFTETPTTNPNAPQRPSLITKYQAEIAREPRLINLLENSESSTYRVEEIEGIGKGFGARLRKIGINQTTDLLSKGNSIVGCNEIAEKTQVETFVVKKWVTQADLLRLPGIRGKFAELLQASHIESVEALAQQSATSLTQQIQEMNNREHRSSIIPSLDMVSDWISAAQKTPNHPET